MMTTLMVLCELPRGSLYQAKSTKPFTVGVVLSEGSWGHSTAPDSMPSPAVG